MWWEHILIALIAAIPPTLMGAAAWRKAGKADKKVSTSNGHTAGQMIESNYELTKSVSHRQDEMSKALETHVLDQESHCREAHELARAVRGSE